MTYIVNTNSSIPLSPKTSNYFPDGHGRDSYIYTNNGGLSKSGLRIISSNDFMSGQNSAKFSNLTKNPGPIKYFCDGSGRDSYVSINSGGFQRNGSINGNLKLNRILRNPSFEISPYLPKYSNSPKNSFCKNIFKNFPAPYRSKKELEATRGLKALETDLINRLYYSESNNKIHEPMSPKNSYRINKDLEEDFNLKSSFNNDKKINNYNYNIYLEKLASYESKKLTMKK